MWMVEVSDEDEMQRSRKLSSLTVRKGPPLQARRSRHHRWQSQGGIMMLLGTAINSFS